MSTADIEYSLEDGGSGINWFRRPAVPAQQGEPAFFKIASMARPEYQEALARAYMAATMNVIVQEALVRESRPAGNSGGLIKLLLSKCAIEGAHCFVSVVRY
jgi:hypothetical protein